MAENQPVEETKKFTPKDPPKLNPPKDDPMSVADLAKCDGKIALYSNPNEGATFANLLAIRKALIPTTQRT
jgi:hypothetical protein